MPCLLALPMLKDRDIPNAVAVDSNIETPGLRDRPPLGPLNEATSADGNLTSVEYGFQGTTLYHSKMI
ncbi:hypothetical protein JZ751_000947 [Albula glossodonta]|uniref:Uncharacterized protein n=1 Tax=Albula glossodonta TaxID=121402 RepID=A0A8T2PXQ5_9TELE|nr:hypothetical protein JZ751_000947 [Albula glossodonta]